MQCIVFCRLSDIVAQQDLKLYEVDLIERRLEKIPKDGILAILIPDTQNRNQTTVIGVGLASTYIVPTKVWPVTLDLGGSILKNVQMRVPDYEMNIKRIYNEVKNLESTKNSFEEFSWRYFTHIIRL